MVRKCVLRLCVCVCVCFGVHASVHLARRTFLISRASGFSSGAHREGLHLFCLNKYSLKKLFCEQVLITWTSVRIIKNKPIKSSFWTPRKLAQTLFTTAPIKVRETATSRKAKKVNSCLYRLHGDPDSLQNLLRSDIL